jgi:hypothetical protein
MKKKGLCSYDEAHGLASRIFNNLGAAYDQAHSIYDQAHALVASHMSIEVIDTRRLKARWSGRIDPSIWYGLWFMVMV